MRPIPGTRHGIEPLRRLFAARHFGAGERVIEDFDGDLTLHVDISTPLGSWLYWHGYQGVDELMVLERCLRPDSVFVDVGANIGQFTLFAAKRVPRGRVIALEPEHENHRRLVQNVRANAFENVTTLERGAAEQVSEAALYDRAQVPGPFVSDGALVSRYPAEDRDRPVGRARFAPLDQILEPLALDRVDVIKLDIEGGELPALRGATRVLERDHPALIVELSAELCRQAGYDPKALLNFLAELGYKGRTIGQGSVLDGWGDRKRRHGQLGPLNADALPRFSNLLFT